MTKMRRMNSSFGLGLKVKFLLLVVFVVVVLLGINDYWLIEPLVRYVCTSCVGLG